MQNKILKTVIIIATCITLSFITEIFIFNFKTITSNTQSSTLSYTIEKTKEKNIIKIDSDNSFINKLIVNYDTTKNVPFELAYSTSGPFDNNTDKIINDIFDSLLPTAVINLGTNVSNLAITYPENYKLNISDIQIDNNFHFNITRFIFILLLFTLISLLIVFYRSGFSTEKLHIYFAVICTILGTMIILVQPAATFYSFDDQTHFQRTLDFFDFNHHNYSAGEYSMSEADIAHSVGRDAIDSIEEQNYQNDYLNSSPNTEYFNQESPFPTYDKIAYFPMFLGYKVPKLIGLPFTVCFKIGKLFNLILYILLMSYAIKNAKVGKRLLAFIALLPANIFLASEYSYDPAVFSGIAIFSVELINLLTEKNKKMSFKTLAIIITSISYACFTKAIYAPLILLTLLIPTSKFANKKQALKIKGGLIAITLALLSTFILPVLSGTMASDTRGGNTSVSDQLSLIMSHPFDYAEILKNNAVDSLAFKLIGSYTFSNYAYIRTPVTNSDSNLYLILLAFFLFLLFTDNSHNNLSKRNRSIILILNAIVIISIWTALYLSYTPVGSAEINGVQNRYFLPLLFLIAIALQPHNIQNNISPKFYNTLSLSMPTIITIIVTFTSILIPYAS